MTPSAAVGYFTPGTGIDLGAHTEFRTGAEFDYRFENLSRLGVGFYHMSNAGIGKQIPGVELVTFVLTMPLRGSATKFAEALAITAAAGAGPVRVRFRRSRAQGGCRGR